VASTLSDEDITTTTLVGTSGALADPDGTDGDADGKDTGGDGAPAGDTTTDGDGSGDAD
jgi:hypothetical protein